MSFGFSTSLVARTLRGGGEPVPPLALSVLAKYGANAHLWMPGVGVVNGVTAGNWIDSAGTQPAAKDGPVGNVSDTSGGTVAASSVVDVHRPTLRLDTDGNYYWEFSGNPQYLSLSAPVFQLSDDFCIVAGVSLLTANSARAIFAQSNAGNHALPEFMFDSNGRLGFYAMGGGTIVNAFSGPSNTGVGPIVASTVSKTASVQVRRNGALLTTATLSGAYAAASTAALAAFPTLNASEFLPGSLYPVIVIKGTVTDTDLQILEHYVGQCSGVAL